MKLFLCSSFITPEIKPDFEKLIGRSMNGFKIACITTAIIGYKPIIEASGQEWDLTWLDTDIEYAQKEFGCTVDKYDFNEMTYDEISDLFDNYDGIWIQGGIMGHLLKSVYEKNLKDILIRFIKEKFYIGSSAGSMICSKSQDASEWYIGEAEQGVSKYEGLGIIPFQIYPHYDEKVLKEILKARRKDQEYWLLKDGQAISYNGEVFTICGGNITVIKSLNEIV